MKHDNILLAKSYTFALNIVSLYKELIENENEYVLSRQLLKCGTSIGANAEEAIGAQSRKDFKAKLSISYKEARETHYWIRLLKDSKYIDAKKAGMLLKDCDELLKILGSIINTLKNPNS